jgi:uncharacterized repeat protein (TIGR01451 family)
MPKPPKTFKPPKPFKTFSLKPLVLVLALAALPAVAFAQSAFTLTKTGTPDPVETGGNLTYTLTASNNQGTDLEEAALSDPLPAGTTFVSLAAPAGFTCTTPAVGATGTVSCDAIPFAPGSAVFTLVLQVGPTIPGGTTLDNLASLTVTDNGRNSTQTASASSNVVSPAAVTATKTVSGFLQPGGPVTYTVVLTNSSTSAQGDNPGHEFTDVLPPQLTLVSATSTSGIAVATVATRTVTWDGGIAAGGSVTITLQAMINPGTPEGTISNQGSFAYDADGNGTNEASGVTDDPATAAAGDPTAFQLIVEGPMIPTLDTVGLVFLTVLLALASVVTLRRAAKAPLRP